MPLVVYSLLRLALVGICWALLVWVGLNPWAAVVVAALVAWGLSYVALSRPRDAAARWLADRAARRRDASPLSARARQDAADEDALVEAQDGEPLSAAPGQAQDEERPSAAPDEAQDEERRPSGWPQAQDEQRPSSGPDGAPGEGAAGPDDDGGEPAARASGEASPPRA